MMTTRIKILAIGATLACVLGMSGFPTGASAHALSAKPRLSFHCSNIPPNSVDPIVTCRLAGQGFYRGERLHITYRVELKWMQGAQNQNHQRIALYHRTGLTDEHGDFRRPTFSFTAPTGSDVRLWFIGVKAEVTGVRGDHASVLVSGVAD